MPGNDSSPGRREKPPKKDKCPQSSSNPVTYSSGQIVLSETDLEWSGLGFTWRHRRSYANALEGGGGYGGTIAGEHGHHWFLDDMPFLSFGNDPGTGTPTIGVITGATGSGWFIADGSGGWRNQFSGRATLQHDTVAREYVLVEPSGARTIFHDDDGGLSEAIRGRLKGIENPGGARAALSYNLDSELDAVTWSGANGGTATFRYTYFDDIERLGLIESATLVTDGKPVRRAAYDYYGLDDENGPLRTLRNAVVEEAAGLSASGEPVWQSIREQWYRYYTDSDANGSWKYGLRLQLGPVAVNACRAQGIDPASASDGELVPYASHRYEFTGEGRVSKETIRGGEAEYTFEWLTSSADPTFADVNDWYRRCIETRPDGSTRRVYSNRGGSTLLDRKVEAGANPGIWDEFFVYDDDYNRLEYASSAAVASVTEPATAADPLVVALHDDEGLIHVNDYYAADDFPNGEVKSYLKSRGVKTGSNGSVAVQSKFTYTTRTVGSASIHPLAEELGYPVAGAPDAEAAKTTHTYTWYDDEFSAPTFQVEEKVTTLPVISTDDHGTGQAESMTTRFDRNGFETWTRDARGTMTRFEYDELTGATVRRIDDADPEQFEDAPLGWLAPASGTLHLVTDFENDRQGRPLREIGPQHTATVDVPPSEACDEPGHEPVSLRSVIYRLYRDAVHQTWAAQGYVTDYGGANEAWHLEGPVTIDRRDAGGNSIDEIQARPDCRCGGLNADSLGSLKITDSLPRRELWTRWTKTERDFWGRKLADLAYAEIPLEGDGLEESNYLKTTFGYDTLNQVDRRVATDGTITRTVTNRLGDITEEWVGTDDAGATADDPGNGGNNGNNLVAVHLFEYDGGAPGGNANLTKETRPVDNDSNQDRITTFTYDDRDRRIESVANDGTRDFIEETTYDNLDQILSTTRYHTTVDDSNRIGREESDWDLRGRLFENKQFGADPATGNLTDPLVAGLWYDPKSNVIAETTPGASMVGKTVFDALNRDIIRYRVVPGTLPAGAAANDVSNDTVVEQDEIAYDSAGNSILFTHRQRLHDATGTGALGTVSGDQPQARVSFRALYFDPIGRFRFEADFGTNGGAVRDRPVAVPESSSTVLVSETRYARDGQPGVQIDREGVKTITKRDKLSRDVETVEAAGTNEARTTQFRWHPSGQLEALILANPDTGEEVTTWRYGSTLAESGVARNDLPVGKIYPTGESETQTWNRQSDLLAFIDCNGSEHAYAYDKLGQLTRDAVPTLAEGIDDSARRLDFTFNDQGRLSLATSWSDPEPGSGSVVNEVGFTYDAFGSLASDAQEHSGAVNANTPKVSYARTDGSNNLYRQTGITYPTGVSQEFHYGASGSIDDAFNRADRLKVAGEATDLVAYEFAGIGRVVMLDYPGTNAKLSYLKPANFVGTGDAGDNMTGYDRFGRTVAMPWAKRSDGTPLADVGYGYDCMSRRTFRGDGTPAADGEFDQYFAYDPLGQIKQRSRGTLNGSRNAVGGIPEENESWRYDEQGNWLGYDLNEDGNALIQQTRTHNRSNQIVSINGSGAGTAYDANGNMILIPTGRDLEGEPNQVTWDAWNRIAEVRDDAGALVAEYRYDALYRRVTRQLPGEALRHTYYNQAWRPVEEREGTGADAVKLWWWGDRHRDDLARRDRDTNGNGTLNESLWCLMDYFDPIAVVDSSGDVEERYSYSAFGVSRIAAPDYSVRASSAFDWEFRFHGQFEDVETGWMNYGYRYYVPMLGRWPSRDPIGVRGGRNLYSFSKNCPVKEVDILGLFGGGMMFLRPMMVRPQYVAPRTSPVPTTVPKVKPKIHPRTGPMPPGPPSDNDPDDDGDCEPCDPPEGTRVCEFVPKGTREKGRHKQGGPDDCDHCKFWKVHQATYPKCSCHWRWDGNEDDCEKCPDGMGKGPPSGDPGGGGKSNSKPSSGWPDGWDPNNPDTWIS